MIAKPPFGTPRSSSPLNRGLCGSWLFNEPSGTVCYDGSGRGLHGYIEGSVERAHGQRGSLLSFGGAIGDQVRVPLGGTIETLGSLQLGFSLSCVLELESWFSAAANEYLHVISMGSIFNHLNTAFNLTQRIHKTVDTARVISVHSKYLGGLYESSALASYNEGHAGWVHVVAVIPVGSPLTGWLDGVDRPDGQVLPQPGDRGDDLRFGSPVALVSTARAFPGKIASVQIWNRVLSSDEAKILAADPYANYRSRSLAAAVAAAVPPASLWVPRATWW